MSRTRVFSAGLCSAVIGEVAAPLVDGQGALGGRVHVIRRVVFVTLVLVALVSGYLGFHRYLQAGTRFAHDPLDLLYDDLQLFVLGPFPLQQGGGPYPLLLQIGRLAAPLVTAFAFIEAGRLYLATELRRWRVRSVRGHVVICGSGSVASTLADRLTAAGERVVLVQAEVEDAERACWHRVHGDPRAPAVLRAAGTRRAAELYACTGDTAANTVIALEAGRIAGPRNSRLSVHALVTDPDLCLALQARHLGMAKPLRLRLGFFNVDELAARKLFSGHPLPDAARQAPRVLVAGGSAFGCAVVVELARRWRAAGVEPGRLPTVTVVDADATTVVRGLVHRYPFLPQACRLLPDDSDSSGVAVLTARRPDWVFLCYDDEERCLKTALTFDQLWHGGPRSIVVRLDRLTRLRDAFDGTGGNALLDEVSGSLHLFGVIDAACDPELIDEDVVERLARVIHDRYRGSRLRRGDRPSGNPSLADWDHLPSTARRSNRAQAEDLGRKLGAVGCALAPRVLPGEEYAIRGAAVETLARMEHGRWLAERANEGWCYAELRDDTRRRHPDLRPWEELSEEARDKCRDAITELADVVGDAGFRVVRI
jgi:hypothetical protein